MSDWQGSSSIPMLMETRSEGAAWALNFSIADSSRGSTGGRRTRRVRTAFVVAEIALSLVLVAGAGLLTSTA